MENPIAQLVGCRPPEGERPVGPPGGAGTKEEPTLEPCLGLTDPPAAGRDLPKQQAVPELARGTRSPSPQNDQQLPLVVVEGRPSGARSAIIIRWKSSNERASLAPPGVLFLCTVFGGVPVLCVSYVLCLGLIFLVGCPSSPI